MPFFRYGAWRPDQPDYAGTPPEDGTLRLTLAQNVLLDTAGVYQPFQTTGAVQTRTLSATVIGAFACLDALDRPNWFAGTADSLYRISSNTATWSTVGTGFVLTVDDRWSFVRYGNQVFAGTVGAAMQHITMSAGAAFAAVGGAAPQAKSLFVVRNFLVSTGTSTNPQRLQWSGLDAPLSWTVDSVTLADFQDLAGSGGVNQGAAVGLTGSDAVVFQERAVWRMVYVGPPLIFQIDQVEGLRGALVAGSIVQSGGRVFYLSSDGFYAFDGTTSKAIGAGKIDEWFFATADSSQFGRMSAIAHPTQPLVMWSFQTVSSPVPDSILAYNWVTEEWTNPLASCEILWRALSLTTGAPTIAIFGLRHTVLFFNSGFNKQAFIRTAEYQFNPDGRSFVDQFWPILEGPDAPRALVYHRPNAWRTLSTEAVGTINSVGFCPLRVDDRLMRFEAFISQSAVWSKWWGFRLDPLTGTGKR